MNKIICCIACIAFFACNTPQSQTNQSCCADSALLSQFVLLHNNQFQLHDTLFLPIMLNYVLDYRYISDTFVLSPHTYYENRRIKNLQTAAEINERFRAHFEYIREIGFNTLRLCFDRMQGENFYCVDGKKISVQTDYEAILRALDTVVNIAKESDLKIMLLLPNSIDNKNLGDFTTKLLQHFCAEPTIFAYDFINEPLYFDRNTSRTKEQVFAIVNEWKLQMDSYAPHQLFTIGFAEPLEVFRWDPQLLPVDFVCFHTYHPLRVPNEMYWYGTYIDKPFMIGETGLPADNDSISYEDQRRFMKESYEYARDCGAIGYGWWEFQYARNYANIGEEANDAQATYQDDFNARHIGLINNKDSVITKKNKYIIYGMPKPATVEIVRFADYKVQKKRRPLNYYNILNYSNFVIRGSVINESTQKPIEGAVIRGWNKDWTIGVNTFSDSLGNFMLYSNDQCTHFKISAPGMTAVTFNYPKLEYTATECATTHIDSVPNRTLEYQQISYKPFVDTATGRLFALKPELFSNAQFATSIQPVYVKPIAIETIP